MNTQDEGTKMKDGTNAWLTASGWYFSRPEPSYEKRESIVYYSLDKEHIPLAETECQKCGETVKSKMCGDFQSCSCRATSVDTDRWMPERHRILRQDD